MAGALTKPGAQDGKEAIRGLENTQDKEMVGGTSCLESNKNRVNTPSVP